MNAQELFLKDGKSAGVSFCEKCKIVHRTKESADDCCMPYKCNVCGIEIERYRLTCNSCAINKDHQKEMALFEKAEKLTSFSGQINHSDKFYDCIEDMLDDIDDPSDYPEFVWATMP